MHIRKPWVKFKCFAKLVCFKKNTLKPYYEFFENCKHKLKWVSTPPIAHTSKRLRETFAKTTAYLQMALQTMASPYKKAHLQSACPCLGAVIVNAAVEAALQGHAYLD